jgi:hypothetical protein
MEANKGDKRREKGTHTNNPWPSLALRNMLPQGVSVFALKALIWVFQTVKA